jgi:hypothetical protein
MIHHGVFCESAPFAPEVITVDRVKRLLGQVVDPNSQEVFPKSGVIYILRENPDDFEDDEMIAFIREGFIPHTYRLRAKFATTSGDPAQGQRAMDAPGFHRVVEWMSAFAGTLQLSQTPSDQLIWQAFSLRHLKHKTHYWNGKPYGLPTLRFVLVLRVLSTCCLKVLC